MGASDLFLWLQQATAQGGTPSAHTPTDLPAVIGPARKAPPVADAGSKPHNPLEPKPAIAEPGKAPSGKVWARVELFTRRGLERAQALALANRCEARDLDFLAPSPTRPGGTGMAACMECAHLGRAGGERYRCGNWREMDMSRGHALLASRFVVEFHRCPGFEYPQRREHGEG